MKLRLSTEIFKLSFIFAIPSAGGTIASAAARIAFCDLDNCEDYDTNKNCDQNDLKKIHFILRGTGGPDR